MKTVKIELMRPSLELYNFHAETAAEFKARPDIPARETTYYRAVTALSHQIGTCWYGHQELAIIRDIERYRALFQNIHRHGWGGDSIIDIRVEKDGVCWLADGHHRMGILLACPELGVERVNCNIVKRHADWINVVNAARALYSDGKDRLYTEIDHPEFSDWDAASDPVKRADIINQALRPGSFIIDVGCNHGGISFAMANMGHNILGIDTNMNYLRLAAETQGLLCRSSKIELICDDAWKYIRDMPFETADYILCMSVLHHEAKKGGAERVGELLRLMAAKAVHGVVVELASGEETQMRGVDIPHEQDGLGDWMEKYSGLRVRLISRGVPDSRHGTDRRRWLWMVGG
jgi:precorrin-6B methylase 2